MALFVVFKNLMMQMFFQYLNKCHPNMKFRMETETDGKLLFLDVLSKQRSSNNECPCITSAFSKKRLTLVCLQIISVLLLFKEFNC